MAQKPGATFGKAPAGEAMHQQGLAADRRYEIGKGHIPLRVLKARGRKPDAMGRRLFPHPVQILELVESPAGAKQWQPINPDPKIWHLTPRPIKTCATMMTTADMALKMDPESARYPNGSVRSGGTGRCICSAC